MSVRRAWVLAVLLAGCYSSSGADAGFDGDAPRGTCDPIGSLVVCAEECGGRAMCPPSDARASYGCYDDLCIKRWEAPPAPLMQTAYLHCWLGGPGDNRSYPYRGDLVCAPSAERSGESIGLYGFGIPEADCDALEHVRGIACVWSDGTTRTRTPPAEHDSCPALPTADAPASVFCGGPCGNCNSQIAADIGSFDTPCVGRNDERDLGVCGLMPDMSSGCNPDQPASENCLRVPLGDEWGAEHCVCLSFLREDGFERAGWNVPDTNCLAYRALYPGQVECYDDDWNPLP